MTPLSFFRVHRRRLLALFATLFITGAALDVSAAASGRGRVALAEVQGAIDPGSGEFIKSAIARAEAADYNALVIRLDTPGGLVSTTREIVQAIMESSVPVIVYVAPAAARAGSAGVFITLSAHVAAMAPTTNIGAAHPVGLFGNGGGEQDDQAKNDQAVMAQKIENDMAAFIESIAEQRGRNVEWAIAAVRKSEAVPASKALEMNIIDIISPDLQDLLTRIDGRVVKLGPANVEHTLRTKDLPVDTLPWGLKHRFLHVIGDPNIASILLSLGALGLLLEFYKPGAIVPGVTGAILLLFGVIGVSALPVNVGAIALLAVGIALFVAELFVTSFGLLGLAGAVCFAAGGILLIDNTGENFFADPDFGVAPGAFLPTAVFVAAAAIFVGYKAMGAWRMKPLVGGAGLVGQVGEVVVDIAPGHEGKVFVHGELWNAVSEHPLQKGERARIVEMRGLTLRVDVAES